MEIVAEGGEVAAEEKGGSECERERDRFTVQCSFSAFAALTRAAPCRLPVCHSRSD